MTQALEGIRVLDLSRLLPGPYCSLLLADLGAEVIKIEEPTLGDPTRWTPPRIKETGIAFLNLNRNKKSLTLNLKDPQGVEVFHKLAQRADVILEGFRPGVVDRLGIGYEAITKINPGIVYCSLTGYGQDGPYRDRSGHDLNYLSLAGMLGLTTDEQGRPAIPGVQIADLGGALAATIAILAGLLARDRLGRGQYIDVAMMDVAVALLQIAAATVFAGSSLAIGGRFGLNGLFPFYSIYETKDGQYISVGALEPKFWKNFCQTLGRPDLAEKQFASGKEREAIFTELRHIFRSKLRQEWQQVFAQADACCEPVLTLEEAFAHPQVQYRQMITEVEHPDWGTIRQLGTPFKFSETPAAARTAAPQLGQHTEEILQELGYSELQIRDLKKEGVTKAKGLLSNLWLRKIALKLIGE
ncbi:MAG: CoA transferase [Acidobacteria bacterium]|nr:CoA transferase [Acidobacteriota bacterium]